MLGLKNEREGQVFCQTVLRQPDLAADPRFSSNSRRSEARRELRAIILDAFSALTVDDVIARLDAAKIANAQMNSMNDVWEHPRFKARSRWVALAPPADTGRALLPPGAADPGPAGVGHVPLSAPATDGTSL